LLAARCASFQSAEQTQAFVTESLTIDKRTTNSVAECRRSWRQKVDSRTHCTHRTTLRIPKMTRDHHSGFETWQKKEPSVFFVGKRAPPRSVQRERLESLIVPFQLGQTETETMVAITVIRNPDEETKPQKYYCITVIIIICYHHSRDMEKSRGCVSNFPGYPYPGLV